MKYAMVALIALAVAVPASAEWVSYSSDGRGEGPSQGMACERAQMDARNRLESPRHLQGYDSCNCIERKTKAMAGADGKYRFLCKVNARGGFEKKRRAPSGGGTPR